MNACRRACFRACMDPLVGGIVTLLVFVMCQLYSGVIYRPGFPVASSKSPLDTLSPTRKSLQWPASKHSTESGPHSHVPYPEHSVRHPHMGPHTEAGWPRPSSPHAHQVRRPACLHCMRTQSWPVLMRECHVYCKVTAPCVTRRALLTPRLM